MKCVLFSRPKHDDTMEYLYFYSKELLSLSESLGLKTINKEKEDANKKVVSDIIISQKPNLIMFNGHGSENTICGHKNEIIVSSENVGLLAGSITYALACSSGLELGKEAKDKGAIVFIGYKYDFSIGRDPNSEASPRMDKIAKHFLEPSNLLVSCLLKGKIVKEAITKAKEKMKDSIGYFSTTKDFPEAPHYAPYLYGNYTGLIAHGDEEVCI